ncbi:MAG: hypothetical protein UMR38_00565 [Candidatus Izemoplasma sp.]|nr:hypothetical protein [Candidatus Izemoplasma sp.]
MKPNIYTVHQINIILFIITSVMFVPIIVVFAFIFDLQTMIDPLTILLIGAAGLGIFIGMGMLLLVFQRQRNYRAVKASYHKEFSYLLFISALGVFGLGIIFTYLGGPAKYIPHVVIPLFLGVYAALFFIGRRYFNVDNFR